MVEDFLPHGSLAALDSFSGYIEEIRLLAHPPRPPGGGLSRRQDSNEIGNAQSSFRSSEIGNEHSSRSRTAVEIDGGEADLGSWRDVLNPFHEVLARTAGVEWYFDVDVVYERSGDVGCKDHGECSSNNCWTKLRDLQQYQGSPRLTGNSDPIGFFRSIKKWGS